MLLDKNKVQCDYQTGISKTGKPYAVIRLTILGTALGDMPLSNGLFLSEQDKVIVNTVNMTAKK